MPQRVHPPEDRTGYDEALHRPSRLFSRSHVPQLRTGSCTEVHGHQRMQVHSLIFTDPHGVVFPNYTTGWEAPPYTSVIFDVADNWRAGRIWGRTNCDFSKGDPRSPGTCLTGGCNGGLVCDRLSGTGVPPATLAQFNLGGSDKDTFDRSHLRFENTVSIVDGFNLPMRISNSAECPVAECAADLIVNCPAVLKGPFDASGVALGCKSACLANLDGNPANSANCCTGSHSQQGTCPSSGVQYYGYFKGSCPRTYAYAFDETSGTAVWTCNRRADYTITFCPT
ncbi:putative thaumatin-like protein [Lyophyllum shimeji]|uniref:Thaumatin-like protein n=1 Tax=Lyophyllum shimeji TaxID=47721 RepID=A0A9P3PPX6_LYOSH|nr:putative thaumatin-like protein [Lyophyllum shimeji]